MRTFTERPGPQHLVWALIGVVVVGYVLFAALGTFEPEDVLELTVAVVVLAGLLLAHEWREQFRDERR